MDSTTRTTVTGTTAHTATALGELTRLFLRLGFTAFGGPAAHIAMMKEEVVTRRRWMTDAEFLDLLGATNLIPGPNSTEMAIHIGLRQGGWRGLLLAGCCFILPAVFIVSAFAWAYVHFGSLPPVVGLLYGVKPVIIAVVVQAIWGLVKPAMKTRFLMGLGVAALVLSMLGMDEVVLLFGAGVLAGLMRWAMPPAGMPRPTAYGVLGLVLTAAAMVLLPTALTHFWSISASGVDTGHGVPFGLAPLFLFFLKVGSVLYGSGYVLLAFLRDGLVDAVALADGSAASRCDRGRPGHPRPGLYHRHLHRVHPRWPGGGAGGDARHLSPIVRVRGRERTASPASAALAARGGVPRRGERRGAGAHDRRDVAIRPRRPGGYDHGGTGGGQYDSARAV